MKVMKLLVVFFLLLTEISFEVRAQDVIVTSGFDSSRIYIGDQIKFTITIDQPADLQLSIPLFKDTLCKNIEILSGPVSDSSIIKDNRIRINEKYLITSFDSGYYTVPPVFAEMKNANGLKRFYSDYSQLEVIRVRIAPADTTAKIFDIIKPYRAPLTAGEVLPWILLAVLLSAGTWYLIRIIKKRNMHKSGTKPIINPDPAHIIAFRELEKLKGEKLWQKGEIKYYYTRLTEILRQYLENRYNIFSMELTTGETLDELVKTGFKEDELFRKLRTVLTGADLVKFAKYNPEPSENELHFEYAWDFVLSTKVEEKIPDVKNKNDILKEEDV
jgi:hypothetical protein